MVRSGTIDPEVSKFWRKKNVSGVNRPGWDGGRQGIAGYSLFDVYFLSASVGPADTAVSKQSLYPERACVSALCSHGDADKEGV